VAVSGSLSWGKTIVSTGAVSSDALNLQAVPIEADVQLGASVSFQAAMQGVFNTRSADRPNPIGLHPVQVVSIEGPRVRVRSLEAVDGTPIVDVKPVLHQRLDA